MLLLYLVVLTWTFLKHGVPAPSSLPYTSSTWDQREGEYSHGRVFATWMPTLFRILHYHSLRQIIRCYVLTQHISPGSAWQWHRLTGWRNNLTSYSYGGVHHTRSCTVQPRVTPSLQSIVSRPVWRRIPRRHSVAPWQARQYVVPARPEFHWSHGRRYIVPVQPYLQGILNVLGF